MNNNIQWQFFPKSNIIPKHLKDVVSFFENNYEKFCSEKNEFESNKVLYFVTDDLINAGYKVEVGKKQSERINVPVLFGLNGQLEKYFDADAYNADLRTVIEVEAGRAYTNYQFLKDLFQACMMHNIDYLVIAVRKIYRNNPDFNKVIIFFETLYTSGRLSLPLKGVLIIGY